MIYSHFVHFRVGFALPGASTGADGLPEFPSATKLRSGGFSNYPPPAYPFSSALALVTTFGDFRQLLSVFDGFASVAPVEDSFPAFPLTVTCNNLAADAVAGTHEYDWYLSQRADAERVVPVTSPPVHRRQYLSITHPDPLKSGTVEIDYVDAVAEELFPGAVLAETVITAASLTLLLKHVDLYVQRRSDNAYQWCPLYKV